MTNPVRVLIVASDPLARAGLAAILASEEALAVVGQVGAGDDLRLAAAVFLPDIALWDVGWEGTGDAAMVFDEVGVPTLAIAAGETTAAELWSNGALGLLDRSASAPQIAAAVNAILQGMRVVAHSLLPVHKDAPPSIPGAAEPLIEPLTPREIDVLQRMADGLSNKMIARELSISEHTVKFHVNSILAKTGAQSRTEAVVRATRLGILLL